MGMGAGGGSGDSGVEERVEKMSALVVQDVIVRKREVIVQVPKFVETIVEKVIEVPKLILKEITVTDAKIETRVVYVDRVEYRDKVVEVPRVTIKDEVVVRKVDKPVEVERVVEKLVVREVPIEVKTYKLVEEIIRVPRIQYIPTEVERVVWKDVSRERCEHCGKELTQ